MAGSGLAAALVAGSLAGLAGSEISLARGAARTARKARESAEKEVAERGKRRARREAAKRAAAAQDATEAAARADSVTGDVTFQDCVFSARGPPPTLMSALFTTLYLMFVAVTAYWGTPFAVALSLGAIGLKSAYHFGGAVRAKNLSVTAKTRAWKVSAETDREVLVAGLAKRSGSGKGGEAVASNSSESNTAAGSTDSNIPAGEFSLPRWVIYPDVEKVQWLNILLRRLWPHLKKNLAASIHGSVQPLLDSARPAFMSSLGFSALNFGNSPLRITGVKTYDQVGADSIVVDIGLALHTVDSNILFEVGLNQTLGAKVEISLHDLGFSARLRVTLSHLCLTGPGGIGAISLAFTQRPEIDFNLSSPQAGGFTVTDVPGVHAFLTGFIKDTLVGAMVVPHQIVIPLIDLDSPVVEDLAYKAPAGIVVIRVIGARHLNHATWWHDVFDLMGLHRPRLPPRLCSHFVTAELGAQKVQTDGVRNMAGSPVFDTTLALIVHSRDAHCVDFELLATRHLSSNEVVGTSSVWLQSLAPRVETRLALPLRQSADALPRAADACIDAHLTWMPVFGGRNLSGAGSRSHGRRRRNMPVGVLVVQLSAGHSLQVMDSNGKSDPYVKFTIPGAHTAAPQFSSVCPATINPRWEPAERFEFLVGNSALAVLDVEVLDQDNLLESGARAVVGRQAV